MDFAGIILGAALGVGGMIAKDKLSGTVSGAEANKVKTELNNEKNENDKLRKRIKETERQIEDLLSENQRLHRQYKEKDGAHDNLEDELDETKSELRKLRSQNEELLRKIQEYKFACDNYENELANLRK